MTKMTSKPTKGPKNPIPKTQKMTKISPKPKNYQNTPKTQKMKKNTLKTYKMTKIPLKPKSYQNTSKTFIKKRPK